MASRPFLWLVLISLATSTQAATVSIQWADNPLLQTTQALPGATVTARVSLDLLAEESTSGLISWFTDTTPFLNIGQQQALAPGWTEAQYPGSLDIAQLVIVSPSSAANIIGPQSLVIGEFEVYVSGPPGALLPLALATHATPVGLINQWGQSFLWDARYHTVYAGYVAYGDFGNPGWGVDPLHGHQPVPNPLLVQVVPEPAALVLMMLGALAVLRRGGRSAQSALTRPA